MAEVMLQTWRHSSLRRDGLQFCFCKTRPSDNTRLGPILQNSPHLSYRSSSKHLNIIWPLLPQPKQVHREVLWRCLGGGVGQLPFWAMGELPAKVNVCAFSMVPFRENLLMFVLFLGTIWCPLDSTLCRCLSLDGSSRGAVARQVYMRPQWAKGWFFGRVGSCLGAVLVRFWVRWVSFSIDRFRAVPWLFLSKFLAFQSMFPWAVGSLTDASLCFFCLRLQFLRDKVESFPVQDRTLVSQHVTFIFCGTCCLLWQHKIVFQWQRQNLAQVI